MNTYSYERLSMYCIIPTYKIYSFTYSQWESSHDGSSAWHIYYICSYTEKCDTIFLQCILMSCSYRNFKSSSSTCVYRHSYGPKHIHVNTHILIAFTYLTRICIHSPCHRIRVSSIYIANFFHLILPSPLSLPLFIWKITVSNCCVQSNDAIFMLHMRTLSLPIADELLLFYYMYIIHTHSMFIMKIRQKLKIDFESICNSIFISLYFRPHEPTDGVCRWYYLLHYCYYHYRLRECENHCCVWIQNI